MGRVIYLNGHVYSPVDPFATAIVTDGARIVWVGQDGAARANCSDSDVIVDLRGALVAPGFVDAHVHHTAAGLMLNGLDLHGVLSKAELLANVRQAAMKLGAHEVLIGQGWDETTWADPALPSRDEIDAVAGDRAVYLSRVDAHSALISTALVRLVPHIRHQSGYSEFVVMTDAHHLAREAAMTHLTDEQRRSAIRAIRAHAASLGVVSMHECSGPLIAGEQDFAILAQCAQEPGPQAVLYWGDRHAPEGQRVHGLAGDFFVDGSLGSRTALLSQTYNDEGTLGAQYLSVDEIRHHIIDCTGRGIQAGFHVIGDAAIDLVLTAFRQAADVVGENAIKASRHRLEHVEFITDDNINTMAALGIVASMQPGFDAQWGGEGAMYERRIGQRAARLNPFAALSSAGVILAFGSDAPVLPINPWHSVRAAAFTHNPDHRISVRAAFAAHTRGGHRAAGDDIAGVLVPDAPAHFAIWEPTDLVVQAPDDRISAWSTDPRSGTPGLPDVSPGAVLPTCVRTVRAGEVIYDSGWLA